MKIKRFFLGAIGGYQYISRMLPGSCRYYPTCSEYAKWQFEFNRADLAFGLTTLRILRCNQLFAGGIDYPKVHWTPPPPTMMANPYLCNHTISPLPQANHTNSEISIKYWIVPINRGEYLILKAFDE